MKRVPFGLGWLIAVVMLIALACNCGPVTQGMESVQTAQSVVTQAQGLATDVEKSGVIKTVQAAATFAATTGAIQTAQALGTQVEDTTSGEVPADIPIYQDVRVRFISSVMTYTAPGDVATIMQYYQTEMVVNGWTQAEEPLTADNTTVLVYTKGDQKATVTLLRVTETSTLVGIKLTP